MGEDIDPQRLRNARKALGLTQVDISYSLRMKQASYSDVERGKVALSLKLIKQLLSKFSINPLYLMGVSDQMFMEKVDKSANDFKNPEASSVVMEPIEEYRTKGYHAKNALSDDVNTLRDQIMALENLKRLLMEDNLRLTQQRDKLDRKLEEVMSQVIPVKKLKASGDRE